MLKWLPVFVLVIAGIVSAQAPGISMRIETETGRTQFRTGERISLTLNFETDTPDAFMMIIPRDRMMPGPEEDGFLVSPAAGTSDPMSYRAGQGGAFSILGGMFPYAKTSVMHLDLNQWVRFERPGFYRVHALFHARPRPSGAPLPVESNDIGIEIVAADAEWQAQQLREAVNILETTTQDNSTFETIMNAARRIGYLDTPDAIREAARLLGTAQIQVAEILKNGLLASQHRKDAATAMQQLLRSPDQPVSKVFLETLGSLEGREVREQLAEAVGQKNETAKAISTRTLVDLMPEGSLRAETAQLFLHMPENQQSELLGYQWPKIAGPDMIPALRAIYEAVPASRLAPAAVERLYELDPAQGREIILDEIRKPVPGLPFKTLATLPDATLPGMDKLFAEHLEQNQVPEELISRYATRAILESVKAYYAKRDSAMRTRTSYPAPYCDAPLVAYFLRTDAAWGQHVLEGLIAERGYPNGPCWAGIVGRTAVYYSGPEWEKIAIAALGDSTVVVKSDAVKALARYGSTASEAAVWESFRYWHGWWKDKPAEMNEENRRFEQVFLESFAHAKNWNISADDFAKVRDLCITKDCAGRAEEFRREWKP